MSNPTPPSPTIANSTTLQAIRTKVRRLTRSPSESQLTTAQLDEYINTFVVYDFPEHLRTFNLRSQFTFYTNPYQDTYSTDIASFAGVTTNPLYNFQNLYLTVHPPFYVAGFQTFFSQSREQFFGIYPFVNSIASIGTTGDGVTTLYTGQINTQGSIIPPVNQIQVGLLQNNVTFSSIATNGQGLTMIDVPVVDTVTGNPTTNGNLYAPGSTPASPPTVVLPANTINYATGVFTVTFTAAPAANAVINSQTVPNALARPQAVLFYQNQFVVRPVPDQSYRVNFEVYQRPTALLSSGQSPELEEYWQLVSYGAARKIFQDKMDIESVQMIEPEYREQMRLVLRRTIKQITNERTATIYTENVKGFGNGWGWGSGGYF